jgi:putative ABC transport system permease protein
MNHLKFTLRNFRNRKLFTVVNLTGLTLGIVASSLIFIHISNELSFDRFNTNSGSIFRVYNTFSFEGAPSAWVQTPAPLASFLQNKFPEISKTVRIARLEKALVSSGELKFSEDRIIMADSSIFDVFNLPLLRGDQKNVMSQPNSIILSRSTAEKYFGKEDPVGRILRYNRSNDFTVSGIMEDVPSNSHLKFDMMVTMSSARSLFGNDFFENRMNTVVSTYILVRPGTDPKKLGESVTQSTKEYDEGIDFGDNKQNHLQPLTSIHLYSDMGGEFSPNGDIKSIYILGTIAFLILVVACINYINLSYSVNSRRNIELGMRKIMGARKHQLITQYISESSIMVGLSVIISIEVISFLLPWFSDLLGTDLVKNIPAGKLISGMITLYVLLTIITGSASAWISTRKSPVETLKKPLAGNNSIGYQGILVLFQFGISIALISSTILINRQMRFIKNLDLGFSREQLMIIPMNDHSVRSKMGTFKQELLTNPNILSASVSSDLPGGIKYVTSINYDGADPAKLPTMAFLEVDSSFLNTYGVHLKEGYLLSDKSCPYSGTRYIMNETAVKKLGWKEPIGKKFSTYNGKDGFVTGVISDFHFKSLHEKIEPMFLYMRETDRGYFAVRLNSSGISTSVDFAKKTWDKIVSDTPFEYFFYDNYYDQLYRKESMLARIIIIFSAIAILIACMGLFGLAAYASEKRTKEIGIRKVNGAVVSEVMLMLNREFVKWVSIAFLISTPVAWIAMHKWLESFAYKTGIGWWIFALSGIVALAVALITVSWQSWRAATRNPIEALRYE